MSDQIPDADYIREAETKGVPPYDEPDYTDVLTTLELAESRLDRVVDTLLEAEDAMLETEFENDFRDMIYKVEDIECMVRAEIKKIKRGK